MKKKKKNNFDSKKNMYKKNILACRTRGPSDRCVARTVPNNSKNSTGPGSAPSGVTSSGAVRWGALSEGAAGLGRSVPGSVSKGESSGAEGPKRGETAAAAAAVEGPSQKSKEVRGWGRGGGGGGVTIWKGEIRGGWDSREFSSSKWRAESLCVSWCMKQFCCYIYIYTFLH